MGGWMEGKREREWERVRGSEREGERERERRRSCSLLRPRCAGRASISLTPNHHHGRCGVPEAPRRSRGARRQKLPARLARC